MIKLFCDVCGKKLKSGYVLNRVEYFGLKYSVDTGCWKKMDDGYKEIMKKAKEFFVTKFPKITDIDAFNEETIEKIKDTMKSIKLKTLK